MLKFFKTFYFVCRSNFTWKKLVIYMVRWQCSSPILSLATWYFQGGELVPMIKGAVLANIVGSLLFFWADMFTFGQKHEVKNEIR